MARFASGGIGLLVAIILSLGACAPAAAPAPTPTPAPAPPAAPAAPRLSPEEAAWQNVVKAAPKEGRLVVYDASFFAGDKRPAVEKAFREKYGINTEVLVSGGSAERRAGQAVADAVSAGSLSGPRMLTLGWTANVSRELPVLKDLQAFALDPFFRRISPLSALATPR